MDQGWWGGKGSSCRSDERPRASSSSLCPLPWCSGVEVALGEPHLGTPISCFPRCGVRDPSAPSRASLGPAHGDGSTGFPGSVSTEDAVGDTSWCHPILGTSVWGEAEAGRAQPGKGAVPLPSPQTHWKCLEMPGNAWKWGWFLLLLVPCPNTRAASTGGGAEGQQRSHRSVGKSITKKGESSCPLCPVPQGGGAVGSRASGHPFPAAFSN